MPSETHSALIGMFLQGLARVVPGQHGKPDGWHCYACDSTFGDQKHVLGHVTGPVHIKNCTQWLSAQQEDDGQTMEEADAVVEDEDQRRLNALRTLTLNSFAEKAGTGTATATPAKPTVSVISRILHDAKPSMSDAEKEAVKTYLMPKLGDDSELARLESKVDLYNPTTTARALAEQLVTACGGGAAFF